MTKLTAKIPWKDRKKIIQQGYPSTVYLDWSQIFHDDPSMAGKIINDIIKISSSNSGKPGKRAASSEKDAAAFMKVIQDDDYTILPFSESFSNLKKKDSIRDISSSTGLDKSLISRLLNGKAEPKLEYIEKIANRYSKHPSYFVEYRILYVIGVLSQKLLETPESSIVPYKKLQGKHEKSSADGK